jgi:hypothetical protein
MKRNDFSYYIWIRGFLQFGLISAALFLLFSLIANWPSLTVGLNYVLVVIAAPIFGLLLGALMYYWDKKRGRLPNQ